MFRECATSNDVKSYVNENLFDLTLDQTRQVANKVVVELRRLSNQLPSGVVDQIEHLHEDPIHERRMVARVSLPSLPAIIQELDNHQTTIKDRSPMGMALTLPCFVEAGSLLRVQVHLDPEKRWLLVEVKYCRKEGDSWVAGCEFVEASLSI